MEEKEKYEDTFLPGLVGFLKNLTEIFIAPGLALDEISSMYSERTIEMFESFCVRYLPQFKNAYNWLPAHNYKKDILRFFDLPSSHQEILAPAYTSILNAFYIDKFHSSLSNQHKFQFLVKTLIEEINLLDFSSCLTATCFFRNGLNNSAIVQGLKDNFFKKDKPRGGGIKEIKNSLNAARDIVNYRLVAYAEYMSMHNKNENMRPLEAWFLTGDKGLNFLSQLISFKGNKEGELQLNLPEEILSDEVIKNNYYYLRDVSHTRTLSNDYYTSSKNQKLASTKRFICKLEEEFLA